MNNFKLIIAIGILFIAGAYFLAAENGFLPQRNFKEQNIPQNSSIQNCLDFNSDKVIDTLTKYNNSFVFGFNNAIEYGPTIEFKYGKEIKKKKFSIYFQFDYLCKSFSQEQTLVVQIIDSKQKNLFWNGVPISTLNTYDGQWSPIRTKVDVDLSEFENLDGSLVKVYVWNKSKSFFFIDNFCIKILTND